MTQKVRKKTKVKNNNIEENKSNKVKFLSFVLNLLFYVTMISIVLGAGTLAIMQKQDKSLNGYRIFGVLTNSMVSPDNTVKKGGFRAGDILVIKEVKAKDLKKGDVITYRPSTNPDTESSNYLTHRVVKVQNGLKGEKGYFITTRGDANKSDDMPISERALVGKVVGKAPKIGGILTYVKDNLILSIVFIASIIGFIWVIRMYILSPAEVTHYDKKLKSSHSNKQSIKPKKATHSSKKSSKQRASTRDNTVRVKKKKTSSKKTSSSHGQPKSSQKSSYIS